ncbi:hypothetical protein [Nocardia caishijiensis]|uniref:Uncharacterized protein n=1 Tax=Nocardia caishijiensis TaxID=184756 RepID=A0ABQ6YFJ7_9NOCA|nr:hypothetical protein [Nocardia caishijiensis]KAF0836749.1 hypothetical protein FNL39_11264 [Nocardia caishijiensis]
MTYPPEQQDPEPWGQPSKETAYPQFPQEIPPLAPPPRNSGSAWIVIALVVVAGLVGGTGLLVWAGNDGVAGSAVAASATDVPSTRKTTTTEKPPSKAGERLSYTDYEGPWDFKFDNVELHADWVDGRDHTSCAPIENDGKLTQLGCRYAAEMVLSAEGGGIKFTQFILAMPNEAAAEAAADKIEDKDFDLRPGSYIKDFATGKWRAGAQAEFVVITLATATSAVDEATVDKYLRYRHTDIITAILFR